MSNDSSLSLLSSRLVDPQLSLLERPWRSRRRGRRRRGRRSPFGSRSSIDFHSFRTSVESNLDEEFDQILRTSLVDVRRKERTKVLLRRRRRTINDSIKEFNRIVTDHYWTQFTSSKSSIRQTPRVSRPSPTPMGSPLCVFRPSPTLLGSPPVCLDPRPHFWVRPSVCLDPRPHFWVRPSVCLEPRLHFWVRPLCV